MIIKVKNAIVSFVKAIAKAYITGNLYEQWSNTSIFQSGTINVRANFTFNNCTAIGIKYMSKSVGSFDYGVMNLTTKTFVKKGTISVTEVGVHETLFDEDLVLGKNEYLAISVESSTKVICSYNVGGIGMYDESGAKSYANYELAYAIVKRAES